MTGTRRIPLARAGGEIAVIAVGIALGLTAESWVSQRGERARERQILSDLLAEVEANREQALERRAREERRQVVGRALVEASVGTRPMDPETVAEDFLFLFATDLVQTISATRDQLIAAGDLSLIRDVAVRRALADWSQVIQMIEVGQTFPIRHWSEVQQPFLMDSGELAALFALVFGEEPPAGLDYDFESAVRTKRFRDVVAVRVADSRDMI